MLGLGLSLLTGGALRPYYAVVAAAFKDRVEADGGTVESMSCLKADLKVLNPIKPPAFDTDAQAFITSASITDSTQQSAIDTLVTDLKTAGVWTKMKAIYPIVGGTASSHKFNLKDPRDLDAAFRLTFTSGWAHSADGATPNGTSAYANTGLNPSINLSQNNASAGVYTNTLAVGGNTNRSDVLCGSSNSGFGNGFYILPTASSQTKDYSRCFTNSAPAASSWADGRAFFQMYRTSSANYIVRRNMSAITYSIISASPTTFPVWISALNNAGSIVEPSSNRIAFAYLGDGLTDTEASNFYTAVQAFQTTLSRQV